MHEERTELPPLRLPEGHASALRAVVHPSRLVRQVWQRLPEVQADAMVAAVSGATGTWDAGGPCPDCGLNNIVGISLILEGYGHNHTKYFCRSWVKFPIIPKVMMGDIETGRPCGWTGWFVPGWDDDITVDHEDGE